VGLISGINIIYIPSDPAVTDRLAAAVAGENVPYERGTIASGDQFICRSEVKTRIKSNFETEDKPVIACEMEGAAIGQVCYVNRVPYGILRAISDGGDEHAFADYPTFLAAAAETATRVMMRFVEDWN
jgi:adenosylhomocysteine nucleosidase